MSCCHSEGPWRPDLSPNKSMTAPATALSLRLSKGCMSGSLSVPTLHSCVQQDPNSHCPLLAGLDNLVSKGQKSDCKFSNLELSQLPLES